MLKIQHNTIMFTYTWSVQWKSRSTGNIISSDGGPYRVTATLGDPVPADLQEKIINALG